MNAWRWLGSSLLLVVLALGVSASAGDKDKGKDKGDDKGKQGEKGKPGEKVELRWKAFDGKTPFYQEMYTKTEQTMKVMNMDVKQTQSQTFWIEWTPEKVEGDNYIVKQKIIAVKMDIEIGGNKISFDSQVKDQPANPLTDFFKALVNAQFTLTIDKNTFAVKEILGREEFIAKLTKTNTQLEPLLKAILSDKALKQMADPIFAVIPQETKDNKAGVVPEKGTWERKATLDMGPIGSYETIYTFTLKGVKDEKATIDVAAKLTYTAPAKGGEGLPFKIISAKLGSTSGTGQIIFDMKAGRIEKSDMNLKLAGDLNIEIAGMTTDVTLNQTQDSRLKTEDKNPIEQKK